MSKLDNLLSEFPLPTWRPVALASMALLIAGVVWAANTRLERVAAATGVVAPSGQLRVVQHLEGGIVADIMVREGERVAAGAPLMRIDLGQGALNTAEIRVRLDALELERARLLAESLQIDLDLPPEAAERQPNLAEAERAAYSSRRREYESSLAVLRDQRAQKELQVQSISVRLRAARARLEPLSEQLAIAQRLSSQRLARRTESLALEREYQLVQGEIADLEISLPLAQTALAEARERELFERNRFRNTASDRLRELEVAYAREAELLARANDQQARTTVVSPIDGVVKTLSANTIGGVVRPGEPIMEIVPSNEALVIEARLSPTDIGLVRVGQPVKVKLATYDFLRYGALEGRISRIAADASSDEQGGYFFRFVVEPSADHLSVDGDSYPISAGMTAQVDVQLGARSVLRHLVDPILKLRAEAFREG